MTSYVNQYGTEFAVQKHDGAPALMCRQRDSSQWTLSGSLANLVGDAKTAKDLQAILDRAAKEKGWEPVRGFPDWEIPMVKEILTWPWMPKTAEEFTSSFFKSCDAVRARTGGSCAAGLYNTGPQGIKFSKFYQDGRLYAEHTWPDFVRRCIAQGIAPVPNADPTSAGPESSAAESGAGSESLPAAESAVLPAGPERHDSFDPCAACRCPECDDDACPQAHCDKSDKGLGCIAPDDDCPPQNPTHAAPASRADAGAATQSLSAAGSASLAAEDMNVPAFDYSGLDLPTRDTLRWAEKEIGEARRDYIARIAQAVSIAHDALCATVVQNLDNGKFTKSEESFQRWCESVGIKRSTAYNLLQVQALLSGSTPEEQATLEAASPSLLYAAAKPSAPAELVQAVKDGDITTHKEYQDLLAKLKDEQAARKEAEKKVKGLADSYATAHKNEEFSIRNLKKAQQERDEAIKERDGARDALKAVKMRADKWQAEAEAAKAKPIEAKVVDEAEVNRRAQARANELTAPLREELEALRNRHPADLEEAEQAIRDAYDSAIYTGRVMENAWHTLRPLLPRMDAHRRELAIQQVSKTLSQIQGEIAACL